MFMFKRFATVVIATLICTMLASAQNPPAPQTPGPEVKKLEYFSGAWKAEGDLKPSPFGPGGKFNSTEQNSWMPGGFFLVSHSNENTPRGKGKGLAIFGYDPNEKVYTFQAYNSMGEALHAKGMLSGDTWTWTNEEKMQGKLMRGRYTVKVLSPTSYTFKFEMAPEGGDFATVMEGKATKVTTTAETKK
jgi:Protein of unknown function (DUF1579)